MPTGVLQVAEDPLIFDARAEPSFGLTSFAVKARMGVVIALRAVVQKDGQVLVGKGGGDRFSLRDDLPGLLRLNGSCPSRRRNKVRLLRASGFLLWHVFRTAVLLGETTIGSKRGAEPQGEGA
jgi:hypothetical protein